MTKEELELYINSMPQCDQCDASEMRLTFENIVLIGCEDHLAEVIKIVKNNTDFLKKYVTPEKESKVLN